MPPLGCTKKSDRDCLVCGSVTNTAHMGIDVCRACTVFYRRSCGKKPYACRSSTNQCPAGKGLNCKKCRLLQLEKILKQSGAGEIPPSPRPAAAVCPSPQKRTASHDSHEQREEEPARKIPALTHQQQQQQQNQPSKADALSQMQPCTSTTSPLPEDPVNDDPRSRPLLNRVRIAYEKMSYARLMGELFSRKDPPPPMRINARNHPVYPATFATMNHANRLLMSCIMEFGASCFPEFDELSDEEKWPIAVKFFYTFRMFDNSYRAMKAFPDHPTRSFGNYTLWLSEDIVDRFFDDFDKSKGEIEQAKKLLEDNCRTKPRLGRAVLERYQPDEEEFLAVLALMFWATNGLGASDDITRLSERYRHQIFSELHLYYRDVLSMDDYASRLGELYMFLPFFEHHESVKETFEVFRLLDIYTDTDFTYRLNKA